MGNRRLVSQQLIQNIRRFIRPLNSAAPTSISAVSPINLEKNTKAPVINRPPTAAATAINLDDVRDLFSSVSTSQLLRSAINLQVSGIEPMVDLGLKVMNSTLMNKAVLRELTLGTIRHTIFDHFCAGQTPTEASLTAGRLWSSGLRGMLVYALENANDNGSCDHNLDGFLQTVESTNSLPSNSVSFTIAKITALCPPRLLLRVSDLLRWEYKNPSFKLPWKLPTLPIFSKSSPFYHTKTKPDPLTPEEESDLCLAHRRLMKLCEKCSEANVPLCIDAEDTCIQPAIDYFTYSAALMCNKDDNHPIVYGTIQAYLKDAKERLVLAASAAEEMGVPMGFKLVRGAYMNSERQRASLLGTESPIHDTIEQTHACFNDSAFFLLEKLANGSGAVVLATHNIESGNVAMAKASELGIEKENPKLQFAQLYGMADALSFGLRNAGFQVSKYMPFGPVELVMPYLLRRAEENRGLLSTSTFDRQLLRKELKRRIKDAIV